jgi:predicted nucleotidyltransferase
VTLYDELRSVLNALDQGRVDYALVGGMAVAVWGAPRATRDIDLLVRGEDLAKAMSAVRGCGFTLEALPFEFKDGTTVQRVNRVDEAGNLMTVDFMLVDRNLESAWASRTRVPFADGEVAVVSREALMAMKAQAARAQDLADIQNLKEGDR